MIVMSLSSLSLYPIFLTKKVTIKIINEKSFQHYWIPVFRVNLRLSLNSFDLDFSYKILTIKLLSFFCFSYSAIITCNDCLIIGLLHYIVRGCDWHLKTKSKPFSKIQDCNFEEHDFLRPSRELIKSRLLFGKFGWLF